MADRVEGRITKVRIRNFMTYDHVELFPKKGLNLIVGLNGSGKSSIMCAISLGLAGKPHFTGRATHLSDFIKHGCEEAEIEIELEKKKGCLLIRRKIKADSSEWLLNHSVSSQSEVANAVKLCNIDTSNLCQFLPQEKVLEFSRMDKKQRLENMLKTIGEPHLYDLFHELKVLNKDTDDAVKDLKRIEEKRDIAVQENERISGDVKKQENRVRLKRELDDLIVKRKIVTYDAVRNENMKQKTRIKEIEKKLQTLKEKHESAINSEELISNCYKNYSKQKEQFDSEKKEIMQNIKKELDVLKKLKEQAENVRIDYENKKLEVKDEKERLHDINQTIDGLKQQLDVAAEEYNKLQGDNNLNSQNLLQLQEELNSLFRSIETVTVQRNRIDVSISQYERQLSALQNEEKKKLDNLKRCDSYSYQAANWLLENRPTFNSNIYLPIMLEIKVPSPENCKYVENCIPFRDMIAFVCEDKNDYERFSDIADNKGWRINIVMPPQAQITEFSSPDLEAKYKNCGLQCYVSNLFTAPEPILRYLFSCFSIHRIPVAPQTVPAQHVNMILSKYRTFFSGDFRITGIVSRYGDKNMSQRKDFIMNQNLLIIQNDDSQNNVKQALQNLKREKLPLTKSIEELELKRTELEAKQAKIRQEKKIFQERRNHLKQLEELYKQKIRTRDQRPYINIKEEKEKMTRKMRSINEHRESPLGKINQLLKAFVHTEKEILKGILCMNSVSKKLKLMIAQNEEVHESVKTTEEALQALRVEYKTTKSQGTVLLKEIQKAGDQYLKLIKKPNVQMGTLSADDIEDKINHTQAQLSIQEDNEPIVSEYNARKKTINDYEKEIRSIMCKLNIIKEDIEEKKSQWIIPLQRHIENINKKFSQYFKVLNCAGEISLDIPDNTDDFLNYGLQIKLKFRDEEPLLELSQTRHSGGECSVAAIVFILSLQELLEVPFRCIDEINQGMDSVNERKIYQLIADSCGNDKCSQYFLLTPKLLQNLQYPEDVAVHIIFNSSFLNMKLDVKKHLRISQTV